MTPNTPTHQPTNPPILINNPLILLYWLFFRPLALRRYANRIHENLNENLRVWEVRKEVADDPRFQALCRTRWWLLATAPIAAALLWGGVSNLFGVSFEWSRGLLFVLGYTGGTFLSDALYWYFPQGASRWLNRFLWFYLIFGLGVPILAAFLPFLEPFNFAALLGVISLSIDIYFLAIGIAIGVAFGVAIGVAIGVAFGDEGLPLPASTIDEAIPGVLKGGEPFFRSLWLWLLKISHAPESTEQLLSALARQQPIEGIGSPDEHADLLELFCERDLLAVDTLAENNYRFQVPLVGEWIRRQRRLPRLVETR